MCYLEKDPKRERLGASRDAQPYPPGGKTFPDGFLLQTSTQPSLSEAATGGLWLIHLIRNLAYIMAQPVSGASLLVSRKQRLEAALFYNLG
jgi:hypothetical protein